MNPAARHQHRNVVRTYFLKLIEVLDGAVVSKDADTALAERFQDVCGIGVMVVLLAVTVADKRLGVSAVVLYALTYTLTLGISLLEYFSAEPRQ